MLGLKRRLAGVKDIKIDPAELSEAMVQMASLKKGQGNLGVLIVLFPVFHTLLNKFLDIIMQAQSPITSENDVHIDFGGLRVLFKNPEILKNKSNTSNLTSLSLVEHLVEVDEIELEPIPLNDDSDRQVGADKAYEDTYRMLNSDD